MKLRFILCMSLIASVAFAQNVPEPKSFRGEPYRSAVPATLKDATVVDNPKAFALWEKRNAVFIDVLPHSFRPKDLPKDTLWIDKKRLSIPRAIWLPNVGYEQLPAETQTYFEHGLFAASKGEKDAEIVFFCLDQCWMSWNAAKRAIGMGYTKVFWYPFGTDGWSEMKKTLTPVLPWVQGE